MENSKVIIAAQKKIEDILTALEAEMEMQVASMLHYRPHDISSTFATGAMTTNKVTISMKAIEVTE